MQSRPDGENLLATLRSLLTDFTFDRFNAYAFHGDTTIRLKIERAAALTKSVMEREEPLENSLYHLCVAVCRKIGIYYAFCEWNTAEAAAYICQHALTQEIASQPDMMIDLFESAENYMTYEVDYALDYVLLLYVQTHDTREYERLTVNLDNQLDELDRLGKIARHSDRKMDIELATALVMNCLTYKFIQLKTPSPALQEALTGYINDAITLQKKYMQKALPELAQSYFLCSVFYRAQGKIFEAKEQAEFALIIHEQVSTVSKKINFKEFEIRLMLAYYFQNLNEPEKCQATCYKIIEAVKQFYHSDQHPSIAMAYHCLGRSHEALKLYALAAQAFKHAWVIESSGGFPYADTTKTYLHIMLKKQKILERIDSLNKMPTYYWNLYRTVKLFRLSVPKMEELIYKIAREKELLDAEQRNFIGKKIYEIGTFYTHVHYDPVKSLDYFRLAKEFIQTGYDAIWLDLQTALRTQQLLSKLKKDTSTPQPEKINKALELYRQCQALLLKPDQRALLAAANVEENTKIFLFSNYIAALSEITLSEITDALLQPRHLQTALTYLQQSQVEAITDFDDDLALKAKALLAYTLTLMKERAPHNPEPIYQALEQFLLRPENKDHPHGAQVFIQYAKFIKIPYKQLHEKNDPAKIALMKILLDKYQKAHTALLLHGHENTSLETEIHEYIRYLNNKIHKTNLPQNRQGFFTPEMATRSMPEVSPLQLAPQP